jgi:hypothetical protein
LKIYGLYFSYHSCCIYALSFADVKIIINKNFF